jgi:hypothetical protein
MHRFCGANTTQKNITIMSTRSFLLVGFVACAAVLRSYALDPWETVDAFQYHPGQTAAAYSVALHADGSALAVGYGQDAAGISHALAMISTDGGQSWTISDDDQHLDSRTSIYRAAGTDFDGNLYAVGHESTSLGDRWIVRRSSDVGLSWNTVDEFQGTPGKHSSARAFAADNAGNIFVAGTAVYTVGSGRKAIDAWHWIVRKSSDGGATWNEMDRFLYADSTTHPTAMVCTPFGLFVAGTGLKDAPGGREIHWLVRRSEDGGATWQTVDDFLLSGQKEAHAEAIAVDCHGNLYVAGSAQTAKQRGVIVRSWVVRMSAAAGTGPWTTIDQYQLAAGQAAAARALAVDASGMLSVAGCAIGALGTEHWIVRTTGDCGKTWSASDDVMLSGSFNSGAYGVAISAAGDQYVVGNAVDAMGRHWITRKLAAPHHE